MFLFNPTSIKAQVVSTSTEGNMNGYNRKSPQKRRYDMPKYAGKLQKIQNKFYKEFIKKTQHFSSKRIKV